MGDPELNCLLSVCCSPEKAEEALAQLISKEYGPGANLSPKMAAAFMCARFDLAEKGTLQPFKDSIARLAKA